MEVQRCPTTSLMASIHVTSSGFFLPTLRLPVRVIPVSWDHNVIRLAHCHFNFATLSYVGNSGSSTDLLISDLIK
ncbi:jg17402 [Pararge aegeria aegeria]|uniref:Jg17402 protein n=1 Tax=Pararge aegeria aegeria TaxID=348720 RepID=A0A8S4RWT6_9NEOP|nr:jg17402 [Pararge aegeria aegeria]